MIRLPPGTRLRDGTPADADALHSLYHAAYGAGQDSHRDNKGAPLKDTLADVRSFLEEHAVLVAEDADGLAATVALRSIANIRRLAVRPGLKGARIGSAMLDASRERARADGFDFAMLETFDDHPWLSPFYQRHGFEQRGIETFPDGSRWLVMRQRL